MGSIAKATAVKQIDSHTYSADFSPEWTIGSVPHGGYVTATFQQVVRKHFDTTLRKQHQPHTITLHIDFLRRTQVGHATFVVKDIKLGRQTSIVHVTLSQEDREEAVGYITNSNLAKEEGVSYSTNWSLHPKTLPADITKFESDSDEHWAERKRWPFANFRKASLQIRALFPRQGQVARNIYDQWMCLKDPTEKWTNESLGFVVDTFPQVLEGYALGEDPYSVEIEQKMSAEEQEKRQGKANFWYPTLLLNLDVKKALPEEGVRWLFLRLQTKVIKNGRYDLEIIIMDAEGDVVALSHHVCLAVSASRNLSARRKVEKGEPKL